MTEPFTRAGRTDVLKVGLTGGIASGKSTVSKEIARRLDVVVAVEEHRRHARRRRAVAHDGDGAVGGLDEVHSGDAGGGERVPCPLRAAQAFPRIDLAGVGMRIER